MFFSLGVLKYVVCLCKGCDGCCVFCLLVSVFMISRGLCACTEMLWMCVLYVSFGYMVRPRIFAMGGSALLCCAHIFCGVWHEQSASCFVWI